MLNVHAGGGRAVEAARDAVAQTAAEMNRQAPLLIAVTVLTSLSDADLRDTGVHDGATQQALKLAQLTSACGLDGVVCSAVEAPALRQAFPAAFKLITPGIRPAGSSKDDQTRVITPQAAIANGADYLVIGRPITQAADPVATLAAINRDLEPALEDHDDRDRLRRPRHRNLPRRSRQRRPVPRRSCERCIHAARTMELPGRVDARSKCGSRICSPGAFIRRILDGLRCGPHRGRFIPSR